MQIIPKIILSDSTNTQQTQEYTTGYLNTTTNFQKFVQKQKQKILERYNRIVHFSKLNPINHQRYTWYFFFQLYEIALKLNNVSVWVEVAARIEDTWRTASPWWRSWNRSLVYCQKSTERRRVTFASRIQRRTWQRRLWYVLLSVRSMTRIGEWQREATV